MVARDGCALAPFCINVVVSCERRRSWHRQAEPLSTELAAVSMQDSAAQSPTGALATLAPPTLAEHCTPTLAEHFFGQLEYGRPDGGLKRQLQQHPTPQRSAYRYPERFHRHCDETSPHPRRPSTAGYTCVIMHCRAFFAPALHAIRDTPSSNRSVRLSIPPLNGPFETAQSPARIPLAAA